MMHVKVKFVSSDGDEKTLDIDAGLSVMEGAVRGGIDGIDADCGGQLSCATCHVYLDEAWLAVAPPPSEAEIEMLEFAVNRDGRSRLSCQLLLDAQLDGLIVHVPESQV